MQGIAKHDNAILITRYDICKWKNEPCGTLGLAPVAGMCQANRSCSINEDIGLASAFTIAHELGHNFGMQHDGIGNACHTPGHIMASHITKDVRPFSWSPCSRVYITDFLDSGRGKCLMDPPADDELQYPKDMPGQTHNQHSQCKYQHGFRSRACKVKEVCRELFCINRAGKCVTTNAPAALGTTCYNATGAKGWCYHGVCEDFGWSPEKVDGSWGSWSGWGGCTRTCGGGVRSSERQCDSPKPVNGGRYCTGERKRYRSCNVEDCPLNATDFREIQCAGTNDVPFRGRYYKWLPYSGGLTKPCTLVCMAVGYNFYTERAPKVVDGTPCYPDLPNICINGKCKKVGCDKKLDSDAKEDHCRVCGGNGTQCEMFHGKFTDSIGLADGGDKYQIITTIPQGAVHVRVEEIEESKNYIALKSGTTNRFYINGAWKVDWPKAFQVAGTVFHYKRPRDAPESLTALGPTSEDLIILLLIQEENKGIKYNYTMPIADGPQNASEYVWEYTSWSQCSQTCAKGYSQSLAVCVQKKARTIVNKDYCFAHLKPKDRVKSCQDNPCPPEWKIGSWSECSKTCGFGYKYRTVDCISKFSAMGEELLDPEDCPPDPPNDTKPCNTHVCPAQWAKGNWQHCSKPCGKGVMSRHVYCVSKDGNYLPEYHCRKFKKPAATRKCFLKKCPPPKWQTGRWGKCSVKCGEGVQTRSVQCLNFHQRPSTNCNEKSRPIAERNCEGECKPAVCKDVNKVAYCPLVLKFQFCERQYFHDICCKTCTEAGFSSKRFRT